MGPVSSITFVDNNWKFVSFGDDKKIIQYELGYQVIIKNLFYEEMPSICWSSLHPNGEFLVG